MEISNLFELMDKLDNGDELPEGWNEENIFTALRGKVDGLANKFSQLKANLIVTTENAKEFAATKKVSGNEIDRFKSQMVHCFRGQTEKKFAGEKFTAGLVVKKTIRPTREPKMSDYTSMDRMKFVQAGFEMKQAPNAEVYAALKDAGLEEFCGYTFSWDAVAMKAESKIDKEILQKNPKHVSKLDSFTETVDSSFVQFRPKKGK